MPKFSKSNITKIISKNKNDSTVKLSLQKILLLALAILAPFMIALIQFSSINHPSQSYSHPLFPTFKELYTPAKNASLRKLNSTIVNQASNYINTFHSNKFLTLSISLYTSSVCSMSPSCPPPSSPCPRPTASSLALHSPVPGQLWSPPMPQFLTPQISSKQRNRLVKATNGNRDSKGIRLAHWNPGSAHLRNKMDTLELVVADHQPHLLGISEANFKKVHDVEDVQLQDYELFFSKTLENNDLAISRVVCYKHNSLVGGVRADLMCDNFSSIWMEIGLPRKRKFLVCQLYREWQYIGQPDDSSRSIPSQLNRWVTFLDQWERALDTGKEVIVMGDCNLDFLKFNDVGPLQPLVDLVLEKIYPYGVQQLIKVSNRPGHDSKPAA